MTRNELIRNLKKIPTNIDEDPEIKIAIGRSGRKVDLQDVILIVERLIGSDKEKYYVLLVPKRRRQGSNIVG